MAAAPDINDVLLADRTNRKKRLFEILSEKSCFMASHNTDWSDTDQVKGWGKDKMNMTRGRKKQKQDIQRNTNQQLWDDITTYYDPLHYNDLRGFSGQKWDS